MAEQRMRQLSQELDEFDFRMGRCSFTSFSKSKSKSETSSKTAAPKQHLTRSSPVAVNVQPPAPVVPAQTQSKSSASRTTRHGYTRHADVRLKFGKSTIAPNVKAWTQQTSSFYCPATNRPHQQLFLDDHQRQKPQDYPTQVHQDQEQRDIQRLMLEMDAVQDAVEKKIKKPIVECPRHIS